MKTCRQFASGFVVVALLLLFFGCASNKINWETRVGHYTYDQAVTEFGPPDKMAILDDRSKVAEWYSRQNSRMSVGLGTGFSSGAVGMGVGAPVGSSTDRSLRLTFGADGILKSWKR